MMDIVPDWVARELSDLRRRLEMVDRHLSREPSSPKELLSHGLELSTMAVHLSTASLIAERCSREIITSVSERGSVIDEQ